MRVLTFSTKFPAYHPKAGQSTHFIEKLWAGWADLGYVMDKIDFNGFEPDFHVYYNAVPKWHTIRAGNRWKAGDFFSPRIWSGRPYNSSQITIAPPIEIKKIWDFKIDECGVISVGGFYLGTSREDVDEAYQRLAKNDGLSEEDMMLWFPRWKRFDGQVICWNDKIEY